jgi:hypothetical protein
MHLIVRFSIVAVPPIVNALEHDCRHRALALRRGRDDFRVGSWLLRSLLIRATSKSPREMRRCQAPGTRSTQQERRRRSESPPRTLRRQEDSRRGPQPRSLRPRSSATDRHRVEGLLFPQRLDCAWTDVALQVARGPTRRRDVAVPVGAVAGDVVSDVVAAGFAIRRDAARGPWGPPLKATALSKQKRPWRCSQ